MDNRQRPRLQCLAIVAALGFTDAAQAGPISDRGAEDGAAVAAVGAWRDLMAAGNSGSEVLVRPIGNRGEFSPLAAPAEDRRLGSHALTLAVEAGVGGLAAEPQLPAVDIATMQSPFAAFWSLARGDVMFDWSSNAAALPTSVADRADISDWADDPAWRMVPVLAGLTLIPGGLLLLGLLLRWRRAAWARHVLRNARRVSGGVGQPPRGTRSQRHRRSDAPQKRLKKV